jgi:hypothetical protein
MKLIDSINWFFNPAWAVTKIFTFWVGDSGPSGPSQTNVTNSNLPDYVQPYVMSMLGAAQNQMFNMDSSGNISGFKPYTPYSSNMNDYVAGFSPMQQQSFQGAKNLQLPGQYGQATKLAGASGLGSLGIAGQAGQAGNNYFGMASNAGTVNSMMNPYIKDVLNPALQLQNQQYGAQNAAQQGQATAGGAFGGSREALMESLNNQNQNLANSQLIGNAYNNAYTQAQQNILAGNQLGLQGQQAALQGYGQAGQAAGLLGQLGQQQLTGQEGIIGLQNQYGAQQQANQQQMINQAIQNYAQEQQQPMQNLANLSALLHGLPLQNTTTQSYQVSPSMLSQIGGLGLGAYGVSQMGSGKAAGGKVSSYVGGGITSLENRQRIAANYNPQQLQREVQNGVLPSTTGMDLSQDYTNYQRAAQAAKAAAAPQQTPGITQLPTNLPIAPVTNAAEGGILAFAEGGEVPRFANNQDQPVHVGMPGGSGITPSYNYYNSPPGSPDINAQIQAGLKLAVDNTVKKMRANLPLTSDEKKLLADNGFINAQSGPTAATPQFVPGTQVKPTQPQTAAPAANPNLPQMNGADSLYTQAAPQADPNANKYPELPDVAMPDFGKLKNELAGIKPLVAPTINDTDYLSEKPTMEGITSLREGKYKELGISEDAYKDMLGNIKQHLGDIEKDKRDSVASAIAMAGFGMAAGTSPYAARNIAEGIMPAIKGYKDDMDKIETREDKLQDKQFAVQDSLNKFRQTGADADLKQFHDDSKEYNAEKRDLTKLKIDVNEKYDTANLGLKENVAKASMDVSAKQIEFALQKAGIDTQRFSAQTQRLIAERPDIASTLIGYVNSDKEFQGLSGADKAAKFASILALEHSTGGSQGYTMQAKLEDQFGMGGTQHDKYTAIKAGKDVYNGKSGYDAAEAFRRNWINTEMGRKSVIADATNAKSPGVKFLGYE